MVPVSSLALGAAVVDPLTGAAHEVSEGPAGRTLAVTAGGTGPASRAGMPCHSSASPNDCVNRVGSWGSAGPGEGEVGHVDAPAAACSHCLSVHLGHGGHGRLWLWGSVGPQHAWVLAPNSWSRESG